MREIQVAGHHPFNSTIEVEPTKDLAEMVHDLADADYPIRFTAKMKTNIEAVKNVMQRQTPDTSLVQHDNGSSNFRSNLVILAWIVGLSLMWSFIAWIGLR